jgi:hypothetical protein
VTVPRRMGGGAVHWLTAQAAVFGVMAALLGIVANAIFLDAYGSEWLPATYIAIGVAGIVLSGAVARTAQTVGYLPIALAMLGGSAAAIAVAWAIATATDGAWVSVPLLVLFPILIQLGFVFIGAQGGRLLDIAGIKASFPRIMAGFPVGAVAGGLLGGWLVTWFGRTEPLLLATAIAQGTFAALVWATSRRYASSLGASDPAKPPVASVSAPDDESSRPSMRQLFGTSFLGLLLAYQVLSALGSQLADFLVFDRATAQYPDPADLARFLAGYTAVMNIVSIGFLFLLAGPLLRRYGLRLGITANPFVLTVLAAAMIAVYAVAGAASLVLLTVVSAARIADIALTDGTTRTSINAAYQVLRERDRLSVQAAVEGIGVPVAIAISGVLILVLSALPVALVATIAVTTIVCVIWTWSGMLLYRAYGPALVDALRRRRVLDTDARLDTTDEDEAVARGLLVSLDPRAARLGLDLLTTMSSPRTTTELASLVDDPRPEVRVVALAALAGSGDVSARHRLADEVRVDATSTDPRIRRRAADALGSLDADDRASAARLLGDDDMEVRCAALDSVQPGDAFAVAAVIAALDDSLSLGAAAGAVERLGDAVVPAMAALLDDAGSPAAPRVIRLVRAAAVATPARDEVLRRHIGHRDRELGLIVLERLVAPGPTSEATALALEDALANDARHAARILAARVALCGTEDHRRDDERPVCRALDDEFDLVRQRVMAGQLARYGSERLGPAMTAILTGGPGASLAVEAIAVVLGSAGSKRVLPVLRLDLTVEERLTGLLAQYIAPPHPEDCLRDLIRDVDGHWRSAWLRACAIHAAKARGILGQVDVTAARALGDPIVDEELVGMPTAGG